MTTCFMGLRATAEFDVGFTVGAGLGKAGVGAKSKAELRKVTKDFVRSLSPRLERERNTAIRVGKTLLLKVGSNPFVSTVDIVLCKPAIAVKVERHVRMLDRCVETSIIGVDCQSAANLHRLCSSTVLSITHCMCMCVCGCGRWCGWGEVGGVLSGLRGAVWVQRSELFQR